MSASQFRLELGSWREHLRRATLLGVATLACLFSLVTAPVANAAPAVTEMAAEDCLDTAIHGRLGLGINGEVNAGGPNFVSGVCRDINIRMTTNARFRTEARACLEPSNGGALDCGPWVLLEYDEWQVLRLDVLGGTRWQIQMRADSADTIDFDYTA